MHCLSIGRLGRRPELGDLLAEAAPGAAGAITDGIDEAIHLHHPYPKFMGGPVDQALVGLRASLHRALHSQLAGALREAGFPPVGGRMGSQLKWVDYFAKTDGARDQALQIPQRVTRDFDRANGTSITPRLKAVVKAMAKSQQGRQN